MNLLSLFKKSRPIDYPRFAQFAPALDPMHFDPSSELIAEYEMFKINCPWCGLQTWCYPQSSDIELHRTYEFYGGPGVGSDSCCWHCGRGLYRWWTGWVVYAEYEDPEGGTLEMRDWSGHAYSQTGLPVGRKGQLSTTAGKYPENLTKAVRIWARDGWDSPALYLELREPSDSDA